MSPFHPNNRKDRPRQYMTFEPDGGGWNNIRYERNVVRACSAFAKEEQYTALLTPLFLLFVLVVILFLLLDAASKNTEWPWRL